MASGYGFLSSGWQTALIGQRFSSDFDLF